MPLDLSTAEAVVDPKDAVDYAGLTYVSDEKPGIRRERKGKGFRYMSPNGGKVRIFAASIAEFGRRCLELGDISCIGFAAHLPQELLHHLAIDLGGPFQGLFGSLRTELEVECGLILASPIDLGGIPRRPELLHRFCT